VGSSLLSGSDTALGAASSIPVIVFSLPERPVLMTNYLHVFAVPAIYDFGIVIAAPVLSLSFFDPLLC